MHIFNAGEFDIAYFAHYFATPTRRTGYGKKSFREHLCLSILVIRVSSNHGWPVTK